jgi:thioester reductase-like protein
MDARPSIDTVPNMIATVLTMATTWTKWNGTPVEIDGRVMTPNKAIRRVADHTIDHLAEAQARINNHEPLIDRWHHSAKTTPADLALFTADDLNEATQRLTHLAQLWAITYEHLDDATLDAPINKAMTLREIADHAAESIAYALAIGHL